MNEIEDVIIDPYELGEIINDNRRTIIATHNKILAKKIFDEIVEQAKLSNNHHIVFIYDYNKNTNIEYFDNESDLL